MRSSRRSRAITSHGTWPMCRAVVAARLTEPGREWSVFRALQVAQFTTTLDLETTEGIAAALERVPGIDVATPARGDAARRRRGGVRGRPRTRPAPPPAPPTEFQGKSATTPDGEVRYTAPSLVFTCDDGRRLEAGGFQSTEAYDVRSPTSTRRCAAPRPGRGRRRGARRVPRRRHDRRGRGRDGAEQHPADLGAAEDELIALAAAGGAAGASPSGMTRCGRLPSGAADRLFRSRLGLREPTVRVARMPRASWPSSEQKSFQRPRVSASVLATTAPEGSSSKLCAACPCRPRGRARGCAGPRRGRG